MGLFVPINKGRAHSYDAVRSRKHRETKPGVGRAEAAKTIPIRETARGRVGGMREPIKQEQVAVEGQVKQLARHKAVGLDEARR
jgi:hypothetical protein